MRSKLKGQGSMIAASEADLNATQATFGRTQIDLNRAQTLRKPGYVSEERVTTLTADSHVARSQVAKAEADLQAQRIQIDAINADIKRLEALIESSRAEGRTSRDQPCPHRNSRTGGRPGRPTRRAGSASTCRSAVNCSRLVPDEGIWIQANFKETQVGKMRPGQKARLVLDSFPGSPIEGQVDSLFAASGAQFSLLPPDNATGNFTKVVQRIPVKITFAADNPLKNLIRPGMSVEAEVQIGER